MLSNDLTRIQLMHPVRINYNLAKHKDRRYKSMIGTVGITVNSSGEQTESSPVPTNDANPTDFEDEVPHLIGGSNPDLDEEWPRRDTNTWNGVPFSIRTQFNSARKRLIAEAYVRFRLLFIKPLKDPVEIFDEVKGNFLEMTDEKVDEAEMKALLQRLELSKQRNVISDVKRAASIKMAENKMYSSGFIQYQTEESMISFIKRVKKGLCLTEIDDFDRVIPEGPSNLIAKAEALKVFDNYYILHYDRKKGANPFYSSKEPPKPKDPILFGVIHGSDKLYFIADWIDEFCDLTYKDILSKGCDFKLKKPE